MLLCMQSQAADVIMAVAGMISSLLIYKYPSCSIDNRLLFELGRVAQSLNNTFRLPSEYTKL